MRRYFSTLLLVLTPALTNAEVVALCGASSGHGFFFRGELVNPDGSSWEEDGISEGHIVLVREGEDWDIQWEIGEGGTGYKGDGASVRLKRRLDEKLLFIAEHDFYVDTYLFDLKDKVVAWSSSKVGVIVDKVAAYSADCE